ncbi:MAG TPA: SPFH domain-containing protein [Actinocrinis sp.]|uniref:SPFH domain-containing protein n=1 Tax=Actinocrinis sp. TaxID=1920516 RepID=UPI002DDD7E8F|nr:SPFH domain-containing protein [Actinocrinis sp.]HEV2342636.1 SPFH domain-containing protein [Actinocrinis sp.]
MAIITKRPFVSHFRGGPTDHVVHIKRGKTAHSGTGQSFWFRPLAAVLSEIPVDDRELPLLFRGRTADFQEISVQASVTYRFADPDRAARRLDFALDPVTGLWHGTPLDQVATLLTELAQQHTLALLAAMNLAAALSDAPDAVRTRLSEILTSHDRLAEIGIGIVDVRVVAARPDAEVERALRTPARERIQQEADRAGFERRALAVERERAIAENELQSRIELAIREEQLVARQGANERRRADEAAAAARIAAVAEADRIRLKAEASAEETRVTGAADAEADAARINVYADVDPRILLALATRTLASNLPRIGTVHLAPDTLSAALTRLASPPTPDH